MFKSKIIDYLDSFQYLNIISSGGGASEDMFSMAPMDTQRALEVQAFRIGPPVDIDPTPIDPIVQNPHNPDLQLFPTTPASARLHRVVSNNNKPLLLNSGLYMKTIYFY
ncbi:hypothetical protein ACM40_11095 [Chryseobacterium sp. BLS98]|uniref:hypothetical protein n=1 Tax=Chryseobacterium sp. BLS98 TaxID=885586 RepID=UPI00065AD9A1|nr:hypothetical protein [Chryseobacterium sp. BLS98]KMQ62792.1 hypothetical protein ACM40_11095 [Chryseobacterium sp. BLS98]